jgi:hypothetical protein
MSKKLHCHLTKFRTLTQYERNWKPDVTEDDGPTISERHWGVMYSNRTRKYEIDCGHSTDDCDSTTKPSVGSCKRGESRA